LFSRGGLTKGPGQTVHHQQHISGELLSGATSGSSSWLVVAPCACTAFFKRWHEHSISLKPVLVTLPMKLASSAPFSCILLFLASPPTSSILLPGLSAVRAPLLLSLAVWLSRLLLALYTFLFISRDNCIVVFPYTMPLCVTFIPRCNLFVSFRQECFQRI